MNGYQLTPEQIRQAQMMAAMTNQQVSPQASQQAPQMPQQAPQMPPQAPQQAPQKQGLLSRLGGGISNYLGDPENRARLAMGFNTMRLNPDPNIAAMAQSRIESSQQQKLLTSQANKTAAVFRAQGQTELADMIEQNPEMALEITKAFYANQFKSGSQTEAFKTKQLQAKAAGLVEGTPDYQKFMGAESKYGKYSPEVLSSLGDLRKELYGLQGVKDYKAMTSDLGQMYSVADRSSAAGDLALIFKYMKILDPSSVVRESEFQTASQAAAWLTKSDGENISIPLPVRTAIQKLETGKMLTDEQRTDFLNQATNMYNERKYQYDQALNQYVQIGSSYANPEFVKSQIPETKLTHELYVTPENVDQTIWYNMTLEERKRWLAEQKKSGG